MASCSYCLNFHCIDCNCDADLSVNNKCDRDGNCTCINEHITGQNCAQCLVDVWDTAKNCTGCIENHFSYPNCQGNIFFAIESFIQSDQMSSYC